MDDYTLKGLVSHLNISNIKGEASDGYHYIDFKKIIRNPEYSAMIYSGEIDEYISELLEEKPAAHIIINNVITDQKNTIHLDITKDGIRFDIYESNNSAIDDYDDINCIAFIDTIYSFEEILGENINVYPDSEFIFEFVSTKTYTLDYVIQSYYRTYPKINKYRKFNNMIKELKKITSSTELVIMNYEKSKDELFDIFKDFKYKPYYCTTEKELKKYLVDAVNATIKLLDKKSLELTQFATNLYN